MFEPVRPTVASVVLTGALTGAAGQQLGDSIRIRILDQNGRGVRGITVNWSVSAGGGTVSPATSNTDANGQAATRWIVGGLIGQQKVTLTAGTVSQDVVATVGPGPAASVSLLRDTATFTAQGDTLRLVVNQAADAFGNIVASPVIGWSSADTSVADVAATGLVTSRSAGTTNITATVGGATKSARIANHLNPSCGGRDDQLRRHRCHGDSS